MVRQICSYVLGSALLVGASLMAQVMGTPDAPAQPGLTAAQMVALNPALPTVFVVGDSTARNKEDLGWGDHFAPLFDTSRINVANRARAGRSSRTYLDEGAWDAVLKEMKAGDYVLIQMGHNDGAGSPESVLKDVKGRSSLKGVGQETQAVPLAKPYATGPIAGEPTEVVHTYGWYLRRYIADARAKGATPILLTPTIRNIWTAGADGRQHIERDMGYRGYEEQVGATEHVAVVDMATIAANGFEALGPEKTAAYFPVDHTHTSAEGAEMNARSVADALRKANSPLVPFLKPTKDAARP